MSLSTSINMKPLSTTTTPGNNNGQLMVRIYFVDDTHRTLMVDANVVTGEKLWELVSDKLGLNNRDAECFFVWAQSDEIEWLLYNHQTMQEVISGWGAIRNRYVDINSDSPNTSSPRDTLRKKLPSLSPTLRSTKSTANLNSTASSADLTGSGGSSSSSSSLNSKLQSSFPNLESAQFKLVYRATSVLPLAQERAITSAEAIHLFYIQAIHHVVNSNYPCDQDIALKLASIQLQVSIGDQKPEHQAHIRESLDSYIPTHLVGKHKTEEWEALLQPQHILLRGSNQLVLKKAYLETCQRWVYYGSTFFKAKYIPSTTSFFLQEFEGKVRIGINGYGFHIIDPKAMKIVSYNYKDIVCWDSTESSFTVQFLITNSSKQSSQKAYIFKTRQGELINDLMHDWMVEWKNEVNKNKN